MIEFRRDRLPRFKFDQVGLTPAMRSAFAENGYLLFEDFVLMRFGQRVGVQPIQPERIRSMSLMIADRQEGAFALEVGSISAYASA